MKNRHFLILSILLLTVNSCGVFLQNRAVKNYTLKEKIETGNELNEYQYDFVYLTHLLELGFPAIDSLFPMVERENQKEKILAALSGDNTNKEDFLRYTRSYLSNLHNQHTTISLNTESENSYPFIVHMAYDHWYLYTIDKAEDSVFIGKKIEKLNETPISEVEKSLFKFTCAENKINQQIELRTLQLSNKPSYLKEIGVIQDTNDQLRITFSDSSYVVLKPTKHPETSNWYRVKGPPEELSKREDKTYLYKVYPDQDLGYLQFNKCNDKIEILESIDSYVKPWLKPVARRYVKRQFKKETPSKQIAYYYNPDYPLFKDFMWEFVDSLNTNKIDNLIIDLRNNPGGNLTLGIQLMYFLTDLPNGKGLTEYVYTSELSRHYFTDVYADLMDNYPEGIPERQLVITDHPDNLFNEIEDSTSAYYIPKNRPVYRGKVFVLSNYWTGSAAALLTTLLQDNGIGTVIGTSVGNNPTGATGYTPMKLPKTGADISIATFYQERPNPLNGKVQLPDYWVEHSFENLATGQDPYLEKVKELMSKANK